MTDTPTVHLICSYEAYEPYRPCKKQASTSCEQCGKPYCADHVRLSVPGRYLCVPCVRAAVSEPSSAKAPELPLSELRCPYCGGGHIYRPTGVGIPHYPERPHAPDLLGDLFEALLHGLWDEARGFRKPYAYACATCNFHWNPEDLV